MIRWSRTGWMLWHAVSWRRMSSDSNRSCRAAAAWSRSCALRLRVCRSVTARQKVNSTSFDKKMRICSRSTCHGMFDVDIWWVYISCLTHSVVAEIHVWIFAYMKILLSSPCWYLLQIAAIWLGFFGLEFDYIWSLGMLDKDSPCKVSDFVLKDLRSIIQNLMHVRPLPPLGHIWDVMLVWRKGNINKNCLCVTVLCTIIMMHKDTSSLQVVRLYRALILLGLALCLSSASMSSVFMVLYIDIIFFCLHSSLCLLMSWAWWDWPLTWLTNHHPSVLWRCLLGHVTCRVVSKMTYNVSSGTLNPTIPYH